MYEDLSKSGERLEVVFVTVTCLRRRRGRQAVALHGHGFPTITITDHEHGSPESKGTAFGVGKYRIEA